MPTARFPFRASVPPGFDAILKIIGALGLKLHAEVRLPNPYLS